MRAVTALILLAASSYVNVSQRAALLRCAQADVQALHFYFESNEKRCFLEELPSDTIVEGQYRSAVRFQAQHRSQGAVLTRLGHYKALMWNENTKGWEVNPAMGIHVSVEVSRVSA